MAYFSLVQDFAQDIYNLNIADNRTPAELVGDGANYSDAIWWQSPEGNFYGQTRVVQKWIRHLFWDGRNYYDVFLSGLVTKVSELPSDPRPTSELWGVAVPNLDTKDGIKYDIYYYNNDLEKWEQAVWLWNVDDVNDLPYPGVRVGVMHQVSIPNMQVVWTGKRWEPFGHSTLADDEPERHLPPGFIGFLTPDVELVYLNRNTLSLIPCVGGTGYVIVNSERVYAEKKCSVFASTPVVSLVDNVLSTTLIEADTEYWIYLANYQSSEFNTTNYDFRGRLFLSKNEPVDGYMAETGVGANAILAGKIETDSSGKFRHELDISIISRRASFADAFRDYSDFYIDYINPEELAITKIVGAYGQIYIPEELIYLGEGQTVSRTDYWVSVDEDEKPELQTSSLAPNSHYWLYIINEVDAVNFNTINPATDRPWTKDDKNALGNYNKLLDLRLKLVFSDKEHENYRLTESYPLFYSRCLGHVWTDDNGRLLYAKDISYIKSLVLNPTHFKGQADFDIIPDQNKQTFVVAATPGTAGVVYVGGETVFTKTPTEPDVHDFNVHNYVQVYTESNISQPLSNAAYRVIDRQLTTFYIYMTNSEACWGVKANKLIASTIEPTNGYLSSNWPGTSARWIVTIRTDAGGELNGSWLVNSPGGQEQVYGYIADHVDMVEYLLGIGSELTVDMGITKSHLSAMSSDIALLSGNISGAISNLGLVGSAADQIEDYLSDLKSDVASNVATNVSLISHVVLDLMRSDLSDMGIAADQISSDLSDLKSGINSDLMSNVSGLNSLITSNIRSDIQSGIGSATSVISQGITNLRSDFTSNILSTFDVLSDEIYSALSADLGSIIEGAESELSGTISLLRSDVTSNLASNLSVLSHTLLDLVYSDLSYIDGGWAIIDSNVSQLISDISGADQHLSILTSYINQVVHSDLSNIGIAKNQIDGYLASLRSDINIDLLTNINLISADILGNFTSDINQLNMDFTSFMYSNVNDVMSHVWKVSADTSAIFSDITFQSGNMSLLYSDLLKLSADVSDLNIDMASLSSGAVNLNSDIGKLTLDLSNASLHVNSLYSTFSRVNSDISGLTRGTQSLQSGLTSLSNNLSLANNVASDLGSDLARMHSDLSGISGGMQSLSLGTSNLRSDISNASLRLLSIYSNVSDISNNLNSLGSADTSLKSGISLLSNTLTSAASNITLLQSGFGRVNSDISTIQSGGSVLSQGVSTLNNDLLSASGRMSAISTNVMRINSTLSTTGTDVLSLRSRISAMSTDINAASGYIGSLQQGLSKVWSNDIPGLDGGLNSLRSAGSGLSANIINAQSNITDLWGEYSQLSQDLINSKSGLTSGFIGGMQYLVTFDWIGKRFTYADQKNSGLSIRLDYVNSQVIQISPTSSNTQVVFLTGGVINVVSPTYLYLPNYTLYTGNLYYLYLRCGNVTVNMNGGYASASNFYLTTTAPTHRYAALADRSQDETDDSILIGYIAVGSSGNLSGGWGLWSLYNQTSQQWNSSLAANNITVDLSGFVRPDANVSVSYWRTGSVGVVGKFCHGWGPVFGCGACETWLTGNISEEVEKSIVATQNWDYLACADEGMPSFSSYRAYTTVTTPSFSVPYANTSYSIASGGYTTWCDYRFNCWQELLGGSGSLYITRAGNTPGGLYIL